MSEQENVNQNPAADPAAVFEAVVSMALEPFADRLHPGASGQLAKLLAADLKDCPPRLIPELVKGRLEGDSYRHFLARPVHPAGRQPQPQQSAAATAPSESELVAGIRARFQASQGANLLGGLGRRGD